MSLGFALVGCGRIAKKHAELLAGHHIPEAKLVAVCDIDSHKAQSYGQTYQVPFFDSIEKMLTEQKDIDVVSVLTPSGEHARNVLQIASYRKHVVVEKPMALTVSDADAMIAACQQNGIRLFVVKQNRYNLAVQKLKQALDQGRFGKLVLGTIRVRWARDQVYYDQDAWRGTWAQDGGVLTNQASHHIDLLEWMMGEVESVMGKSMTALVNIEAEDTGIAILKFKNGALGLVEATTAVRPKDLEGSISILGSHGSVEIGGFAVNLLKTWNFVTPQPEDPTIFETTRQNPPNVYGFGHIPYLNHVVDCLQNNRPALVDGTEGKRSLKLISAIYESIQTGREVFLGKPLLIAA